MAKITARWVEEKLMVATDSNNHSIVVGRMNDPENPWRGVKPSELLLMAVATCSMWDVIEILLKQREPLRDLQVETSGDQMAEPPYSFTKIHSHFIAFGEVNPQKLEKAIRLSEDKYCSVINTLRPGVPITSDYEVRDQVIR